MPELTVIVRIDKRFLVEDCYSSPSNLEGAYYHFHTLSAVSIVEFNSITAEFNNN